LEHTFGKIGGMDVTTTADNFVGLSGHGVVEDKPQPMPKTWAFSKLDSLANPDAPNRFQLRTSKHMMSF